MMARERLTPAWRRAGHLLLLLLGWLVYFGFWWKVLLGPTGVGPLFVVIPLIVVVVPAVTLYWILHNLRLYRSRNARRASRSVEERYERDWEGRRVVADWARLREAAEIVIEVQGDRKEYRAGTAAEPVA